MAEASTTFGSNPSPQERAARRARLRKARQLRWQHRFRRLKRAVIAAFAIVFGALFYGLFIDGIGIEGFLLALLGSMAAFVILSIFPRPKAPRTGDLAQTRLGDLAGSTETWLESRRAFLPPRAQGIVDLIGSRVEQLAPQLERLREGEPAEREVRRLLAEHLPALVDGYVRIPLELRERPHAGSTPERNLVEGLDVIAGELDTMTRQIARGELDALATRGRYLETKYREADKA